MEIDKILMYISDNLWFLLVLSFLFVIFLYFYVDINRDFNFSKRKLNYHTERGFYIALRLSAKEHGYSFPLPTLRFFVKRSLNHFLQILAKNMPYSGFRIMLQRMRGVNIGSSVHIGPSVYIDDVYPEYVKISEGASIAGHNTFLTHTKPLTYHRNLIESSVNPIVIGESAWISIGVTILPGVKVGNGSIVASGSVVTKDVPENVMVAGVPAKIIKVFEMESGKPTALRNPKYGEK